MDNKWNTFKNSGKIRDYLSYKNIEIENLSTYDSITDNNVANSKGVQANADNNRGNSNSREASWR